MPSSGETIAGRYDLVRQLGAGAMGSVWLARDTALGREVAVKSVRGPLVEDEAGGGEGEQRAMREARMIARVNHPNAVAIYDVAVHDGHPWLVMEYVPSQNLAQLVNARGPLTARRAAELGAQVAAALADVHRAGIVHRDVKPANVLISDQDDAKITDFGIARGDGDVTLTATGTMWGTPAYFAPEVAAGANPTPRADVWSLGASLYFAVEGSPPHGTDTSPLVLLGRIANQPVPRPENAGVLTPVLARLLDRDPDVRPTMSEAAELLSAVGRPEHDPGTVADATRPVAGPAADLEATSFLGGMRADDGASAPEGGRRRGAPLAVLVAAVLATAALVAVGGLAWGLLDLGGADDEGGATGDPSTSSAPTPQPSPQPSPSEPDSESEPEPESAQPSSTPEEKTRPADLLMPARMRQAVADYYAIMPDDTETGFELLGPQLKEQGFDSYTSFWDSIASVSVSDLQADPASSSVTATVVFETTDGRTSTERHRFGLVPNSAGDGLLIDTDAVVD